MNPLETYLKELSEIRSSGAAVKETSYYGLLSMFEDDPSKAVLIRDMWEMRDGDYATIINRYEDIPDWFTLHPLEVCNRLIPPMQKMLDSGLNHLTPWRPLTFGVSKPVDGVGLLLIHYDI